MTATLETIRPQSTAIGGSSLTSTNQAAAAAASTTAANSTSAHDKSGSFTFSDLLDVINPLQHIPVIDTIYRAVTGDTISPAARIAGDTLYGGVLGFASSIVDSLIEGETGKDIGGHIMATLFGDDDDKAAAAPSATPAQTTAPTSTAAVAVALPDASSPPVSATATPQPDPVATAAMGEGTGYFQTMQRASHSHHAVPLNASIPQPLHSSPPSQGAPTAQAQLSTQSTPASVTDPTAIPTASSMPASLLPGMAPAQVGPMSANQNDATMVAGVPGNALPAMMMKALDKYRTLENQRTASSSQGNTVALTN